jgi:hypothetical protein
MLRPESWTRSAGVSPVRVIAGEPGSRPRSVIERWRAERGVKSLFGGSKHVGRSAIRCESCSLVIETMEEPSRSCHGEGHVRRIGVPDMPTVGSSRGKGSGTCARSCHGTGETRLCSLVSKDRSYKPMVKANGAQRESDGVIVLMTAGRNPTVGKDPDFGHADGEGKRKGMTGGTIRSNHPSGRRFAVNVRQLRGRLWARAKQSSSRCWRVGSVAGVTLRDWRGGHLLVRKA